MNRIESAFPTARLRGKKGAITNAEWIVTIQLQIADENVGSPLELRYADSYMAQQPDNVGLLIARAMDQRAVELKPKRRGRRK